MEYPKIARYSLDTMPLWYQARMGWITRAGQTAVRFVEEAVRKAEEAVREAEEAVSEAEERLPSMAPRANLMRKVMYDQLEVLWRLECETWEQTNALAQGFRVGTMLLSPDPC